ncbi:hypothetical protein [Synechococcus phage S-B68]|nr:hypothetical protein [Synechococcus phage S-B68]
MITLELTPEQAVALVCVVDSAVAGYGAEFVPTRVVDLRKVAVDLDKSLDAWWAEEAEEKE